MSDLRDWEDQDGDDTSDQYVADEVPFMAGEPQPEGDTTTMAAFLEANGIELGDMDPADEHKLSGRAGRTEKRKLVYRTPNTPQLQ